MKHVPPWVGQKKYLQLVLYSLEKWKEEQVICDLLLIFCSQLICHLLLMLLQTADLWPAFADSWFATCFCSHLICDLLLTLLQSADVRPTFQRADLRPFDAFAISCLQPAFDTFAINLYAICFIYFLQSAELRPAFDTFAVNWFATCF